MSSCIASGTARPQPVAASVLLMALSTVRLFGARAQIERGGYEPEAFTEILVVAVTVLAGLALLGYLVATGLASTARVGVRASQRRAVAVSTFAAVMLRRVRRAD